jgi:hypothetical protein
MQTVQDSEDEDSEDDRTSDMDSDGEDESPMRAGFHSGYDGRTDYQLCLTDTPDDVSSDSDNYQMVMRNSKGNSMLSPCCCVSINP